MADEKEKRPLMPISVVAVILAALGVSFFVQSFRGSRPPVPEYHESYTRINARLWQDPFQAVLDGVKADERLNKGILEVDILHEPRGAVQLRSAYLKGLGDMEKEKVTILAFMVPGGPYFEDTESRMRWRYALLAGLNRVGFVSQDAEHVEFIKIASEREQPQEKVEKAALSNIIPIEWLKHDHDKEKSHVLILWVNQGAFDKTPLSKLGCLRAHLKKVDGLGNATFKIIGPAASDALLEMVQEVSSNKAASGMKALEGTVIYSAVATVDDGRLLESVPGEAVYELTARAEIEKRFDQHGIKLIRTVGTDRALVRSLMRELKGRGVSLSDKKNHLLLVSEWDTYYARSFKSLFKEALRDRGVPDDEIDRKVHFISYLRGIDGIVPGETQGKERKDGVTEGKGDAQPDIKKLEQPIGKSQYDYLRRLAKATYELNERLRARGPTRRSEL